MLWPALRHPRSLTPLPGFHTRQTAGLAGQARGWVRKYRPIRCFYSQTPPYSTRILLRRPEDRAFSGLEQKTPSHTVFSGSKAPYIRRFSATDIDC
jgi:hypothetical protein